MNNSRLLFGLVILLRATGNGAEPIRPVSSPSILSISAAGNSVNPSFSADGRHLVFVSQANNLVTNDNNLGHLGVFVYDLSASNTVLVSVAASGFGRGNEDCNYPAISSNGQFIAFASASSNLVPNDTNHAPDVFLRDRTAGVTKLVSIDLSGSTPPNPSPYQYGNARLSGNPLISANGQFVFFESFATNLVSLEDTNLSMDVFVRDMTSETTRLISINASGSSAADAQSALTSITPDGRWVAFTSKATDLVGGTRSGGQEVFVRDLQAQVTHWVSSSALGQGEPPAAFYDPVLSHDGHFVYFKKAIPSAPESLWRFDLQAQTCLCLHTNVVHNDSPSPSANGGFVAFAATNGIYLWDEIQQTNRFLDCGLTPSLSLDAQLMVYKKTTTSCGSASSGIYVLQISGMHSYPINLKAEGSLAGFVEASIPAISPDGRFVAFESRDEGIVTNDLNQAIDIFLRDLDDNSTRLVSQRHELRPALSGTAMTVLSPLVNVWSDPYSRPGVQRTSLMSADAHLIAFPTFDSSFFPRDTNQYRDVFVKDLQSGEVIPISVLPEVTTMDNVYTTNAPFQFGLFAGDPAISANGHYVAWTWSHLTSNDQNRGDRQDDVYVRDLAHRTNFTLVSRTIIGAPSGSSLRPAINSDGTMIAFQSGSTNLVHVTPEMLLFGGSNIYVHHVAYGTNQLVSVNSRGMSAPDSINPMFSPDDQWILFQSTSFPLATNMVRSDYYQLFARNLLTQKTRFLSYNPDGTSLPEDAVAPAFSANSRYVVFYGRTSCTVSRHDLLSDGPNVEVCQQCLNPSISRDGRLVAYQTRRSPILGPNTNDVLVKDLVSGETNLISVNRSGIGGGNASSSFPMISYDGRYVVFLSRATDLVDLPTTGNGDIYLRDRLLGQTMLVSINRQGTAGGDAKSSHPILSADGRSVVFQSFAGDLTEGDYNLTRDLFVLRLAGTDSDHDGMDDDWEVAYFGNLSRDGSGDFDADGTTDLQEFLAGTDPTDQGSVFRVITLTSAGNGAVRLLWNAVPGRTYHVQYKTNLSDSVWTDLPGDIVPTGTTGVKLDPTAGTNDRRFYRVILQLQP